MSNACCKICGVEMLRNWRSGICIHCDWMIGEGYTEKEIKEILNKKRKERV